MAKEQEITGSQVAGALIGGAIGNVKGTGAGVALFAATAPFLGPLALITFFVFPVAGALAGTVVGATIGSKGLSRAAMMAAGMVGGGLLPDGDGLGTDVGGHDPKVT